MMRILKKSKILSLVLAIVLIAAMALSFVSCDKEDDTVTVESEFTFVVQYADKTEKQYTVKTNRSIVGDALADEGLIAGEDGPYGLYVKTVDGVTLNYEEDGLYWSFYVDGEYAMSGVDTTKIEEGKVYSFKAEAAK